jgi:hypothetical protein
MVLETRIREEGNKKDEIFEALKLRPLPDARGGGPFGPGKHRECLLMLLCSQTAFCRSMGTLQESSPSAA